MDKRYQVFVSSTFQDLQDERQEVMQALLELDCIPSGMELFPAANEDQWTLIKKVIDDCDYYIVIIGGRYGSIGPDGISYTEMEYRYALEKGKPIIAFLHKDPGELPANRTDQDSEKREKLMAFRDLAKQKVIKYWTTPSDLGSVVSRSIVNLIKTSPAIGWVRANLVPEESTVKEILNLTKKIEILEGQLKATMMKGPEGSELLAQGEDKFEIEYDFCEHSRSGNFYSKCSCSWNEIFACLSPVLIDEADEDTMRRYLVNYAKEKQKVLISQKFDYDRIYGLHINESMFQTIKVQLRALGLITKSEKARSVKDTSTYWTLTPYGDNIMNKLCAIKKDMHTPFEILKVE